MLPKNQRIPRLVFTELLTRSKYANSPHFSLRYTLNGQNPRLGVSVSKKVSKSAVARNKIRRQVLSAIRSLLPSLPKGLYLLVAKPKTGLVKGDALSSELIELFKSVKLIV